MASISKLTKPELQAHVASLDAQLIAAHLSLKALREQLAMARSTPAALRPAVGDARYLEYRSYVAATCRAAFAAKARSAPYKSFAEWCVSAHEADGDAHYADQQAQYRAYHS